MVIKQRDTYLCTDISKKLSLNTSIHTATNSVIHVIHNIFISENSMQEFEDCYIIVHYVNFFGYTLIHLSGANESSIAIPSATG